MLVVGVTGGIGSGKSTFARMLADRGAEVIDVDRYGHEALLPGEPAWRAVVDRFGEDVLEEGPSANDRHKLAERVFADPGELAALNEIVHPSILERIADELDRLRDTSRVVVLDAALIVETGLDAALDALVVILAPSEARREWLARDRDMSAEQIDARMAAQSDPAELARGADHVVHNDGSRADLEREADRVWAELERAR